MSNEGEGAPKNGSEEKKTGGPAAPVKRTIVGVPSLDVSPGGAAAAPFDPPSTTQVGEGAAGAASVAGESNTAVDMKAISNAEADRVLAWTGFGPKPASIPEPSSSAPTLEVRREGTTKHVSMPTMPNRVVDARFEPRGTSRGIAPPRVATPAPSRVQTLAPPGSKAPPPPPKSMKPPSPKSIKPPPPLTSRPPPVKGRATLVGDAGDAPDELPLSATGERPGIVVPPASARQPKAVTQPPPWGAGRVEVGVPKPGGLPRAPMESVEEISASIFLPDDDDLEKTRQRPPTAAVPTAVAAPDPDDLEKTRQRGPAIEELSTSDLMADESGAVKPIVAHPIFAHPLPASAPPASVAASTQRGHAALPRAIPKTLESPRALPKTLESAAHPPAIPSAHPPAIPSAHPPAIPSAPPAQGPTGTALMHAIASNVAAPPDAPTIEDPSLPPGVPVPAPPPVITHPAWPPPHIEPSTPPPAARAPSTPPGTTPAPPAPPPRLEATDRFIALNAALNRAAFARFPALERLLRDRPKWVLAAAVLAGAVVLAIGFLGLVAAIFSGPSDDKEPKRAMTGAGRISATAASAFAGSMPSAPAAASAAPAPIAPPASPPSSAACTLAGSGHVVAQHAVIPAGVEAAALASGIAIGFAPSEKEGMAVLLDPVSFAATSTAKAKAADAVRRLTPMLAGKSLVAVLDADKKTDRVHGRRYVAGDPPIDVGVIAGSIVAVPHGANNGSKLWTIPGDGAADAVRGVAFALGGEKAYAIALRRGSSIFFGVATGDGRTLAAKGPLSQIDGLGEKIGSPSIAVSGDDVLVAWADRASDGEPWKLRFVGFKAGAAAGAAQLFPIPAGGLGENAMSPGVVGLAGARFLVVWTEGPVEKHQVRAQTVRADGSALGAALAISAEGVHAGQGQAAIGGDGKGVVAFLDGAKREVVATPIACAP